MEISLPLHIRQPCNKIKSKII
uniref:Uncharacterized protein n=1 Tax=Anguilla anguilla TaxID=7936 RepID=A0A0E9TR11_ANGAN